MDNKRLELKKIAKEIAKCKECKKNKYGLPVPGEGNPNAKTVFIGMCPGIEESKVGKPFVGRSGKFLTKILKSIGIKREDAYITSPVKYYPGKGILRKKDINHGMIHTTKELKIIKPKIIILLGKVALDAFLNKKGLHKLHGKLIEKKGIKYMPTFHPAAAMRFPKIRREFEKDFKRIAKIISS